MRKDAHPILDVHVSHREWCIVPLGQLMYDSGGVNASAAANWNHCHAPARPALRAGVTDAERHEAAGAATSTEEKRPISILTEEAFADRPSGIAVAGFAHCLAPHWSL